MWSSGGGIVAGCVHVRLTQDFLAARSRIATAANTWAASYGMDASSSQVTHKTKPFHFGHTHTRARARTCIAFSVYLSLVANYCTALPFPWRLGSQPTVNGRR